MRNWLVAWLAAALLVAGAAPALALRFELNPRPKVLGVVGWSQGREPGDTVTWQFDPIAIYESGKWRAVEETDHLTGLEVELFTGSRPAGRGIIGPRQVEEEVAYFSNNPQYGFVPKSVDGTVRDSRRPYGFPGPPAMAVTAPAFRTPRPDRTLMVGRELVGATLARIHSELYHDTGSDGRLSWLVTAGQAIVDEIDGDRKTDLLLEVTAVGHERSDSMGWNEAVQIHRIVMVSDLFGSARIETIAEGRRPTDPGYGDFPSLVGAVEADGGRGLEIVVAWHGWEWNYYTLHGRAVAGWRELCTGGGGGL